MLVFSFDLFINRWLVNLLIKVQFQFKEQLTKICKNIFNLIRNFLVLVMYVIEIYIVYQTMYIIDSFYSGVKDFFTKTLLYLPI